MHRDLKPENIMLVGEESLCIKIIDFGAARIFDPTVKLKTRVGTPYYIAPEVLKRKYDNKCDIWSCGVIMYLMLAGSPPFNGEDEKTIMEKIEIGYVNLSSDPWKNISTEAKIMLKMHMLTYQPEERMQAHELLELGWIQLFAPGTEVSSKFMKQTLKRLRMFNTEKKL